MLERLRSGLLWLLAVALGLRLAAILIEPVLPFLIVLVAIVMVLASLFRRSS